MTSKIKIKNGRFEQIIKGNGTILSPTYCKVNGWKCSIKRNGTIECIAEESYGDLGNYGIRYVIFQNNFSKLILTSPFENAKVLKSNNLHPSGNSLNGIIGLSDGPFVSRYAFFRDIKFQDFLTKHGISAVKHEDPNKMAFTLANVSHLSINKQKHFIISDGTVKTYYETSKDKLHFEVSKSSWALKNIGVQSILYTLRKDVTKLRGLPLL